MHTSDNEEPVGPCFVTSFLLHASSADAPVLFDESGTQCWVETARRRRAGRTSPFQAALLRTQETGSSPSHLA
eukprot:2918903-Amphidinium_carterae.1